MAAWAFLSVTAVNSYAEFSELNSYGSKNHIFHVKAPEIESEVGGESSKMYFAIDANAQIDCEPRIFLRHSHDRFGGYSGTYPRGSSLVALHFVIDGVEKRLVTDLTIRESKPRKLNNGFTRYSHYTRIDKQSDLDRILPYMINAKDIKIWITPEDYFSRTPSFTWQLDGIKSALKSVLTACKVRQRQLNKSQAEKNPGAIWKSSSN